ncbi:MAG: CoB--CoM heterodisulfide reductase iron-sulfur subunit A family protein [bacterium]|jgi:heterodisulfide reductase subunit A
MARIGVFVCHCGSNIAATVDVRAVAEAASRFPGVVHSVEYRYMCSDPGQKMIAETIREKDLTGVVVAACSPRMHEPTFRRLAEKTELNPFLVEMANIREHCSWVHDDRGEATAKAIETVRMLVEKVRRNSPLEQIRVPVTRRALVVGGGIAGIQAALDLVNAGVETILIERSPSIGGKMAMLDETFPTLDCSQCILTPKMVELSQHPLARLYTYAELDGVEGYVGNFKVKVRQKARSVDHDKCTGCGLCIEKCPSRVPSEFERGLADRKSIYVPFPQAVPDKPVLDRETCIWFTQGKCGACREICPVEAIDYEDADEISEHEVGAIVVATGYDIIGRSLYGEYGYGKLVDVVDGLQFERMCSASGPTSGRIVRPSDGEVPKTVVFIQCVGSRDDSKGRPYCSKICCMYTAKHSMLYKHKVEDGKAYVFYIDVRAGGKGYEEFVNRAVDEDRVVYLRGRVSRIYERDGTLFVKGADTLSGHQIEIRADLVVLASAVTAAEGARELGQKLRIISDRYGFFTEAHPKLRPVETNTAGVFLAGACQAPRDIPDSVSQASAAASKVLGLLSADELVREPLVARVNEDLCTGCFACEAVCPYGAAERVKREDPRTGAEIEKAYMNPGVCEGCGACLPVCRPGAVDLMGFSENQIYSEINVLTESFKVEDEAK